MNIGIVTTWFERGAAYVSRQYRRALEPHHQCFIYARGGELKAKGDPVWDGPRVFWASPGVMPVETSIDLAEFERWIVENKLDIVWFNEQYWWEPVLLCNKLGVKTGGYMVFYNEEEIKLYGAFDFLTCNSKQYYDLFKWHPQAHFLPWGAELDVFKPRQFEPVTPDKLTFFHSCGMNPDRKGTDQLVRAYANVQGPAHLVIHSQEPLEKTPKMAEVMPLIQELQKRGALTLRIETVPAPGLFHLGDVYAFPCRQETLGLTVPEAMACGLPVIVPDIAPMNEFMDETVGRKVRIARHYVRADAHYWPLVLVDENHLTEQMQYYVGQRGRIADYKEAARAYAEQHLDWEKNSRIIPGVFENARKLTSRENAMYLKLARDYEIRRAKPNWRGWVSYNYPEPVKTARNAFRKLARR